MATLETTTGQVITFDPARVNMLNGHDAATGHVVTGVYGITKALVLIDETPQAFMARVGIVDNFATHDLSPTTPNVWIAEE